MKTLHTPVLLLAFNRPEKTKQVFEAIREAAPQKLYVAVDGPRVGRDDDIVKSNEIKALVKQVDWDCETHYLEESWLFAIWLLCMEVGIRE